MWRPLINTISVGTNEIGPMEAMATTPVFQNPELGLDKAITSGATYSAAGDMVFYSYAITNSGNVTLPGPFTVEDDIIGTLADCAAGPLVPGASTTCTTAYAVTPADLGNGSVTNVAYALASFNGQAVGSNTDSETAIAAVILSCPEEESLEGCLAQSDVDNAFDAWLAGFDAYQACGAMVYYTVNGQDVSTLDGVPAPSLCGGSVTVTAHAGGGCGGDCTSVFTVDDNPNPAITPAMDMAVECDGNGNTTALNNWLASHGGASADDVCQQVSWSDDFTGLSSLCGAAGPATVTFTATDGCNNSSSTTATITIEDTTPPSGSCPQGVSGLTDPAQAPGPDVPAILALYSDLCGNVSVAVSSETEMLNDCQDFEVRHAYTVTDGCGNSTACMVTHSGRIPGEIAGECPATSISNLQCQADVPNEDLAYIASFFTGADGQPVTAVLSGASYSETGNCTFLVTRQYTLFDNCGNTRVCEATYAGEDTSPPQGNCPSGYEVAALDDIPPPDADWIRGHYLDNCSPVSVQILRDHAVISYPE